MKIKKVMLIVLLLTGLCKPIHAQMVKNEVRVTNIRSPNGKIILNIFKDKNSYEEQKPSGHFSFAKAGLANGALTISLELNPGTYGITLVDDENANGKIDKNFMGIPKEGFGFANFFMTGFSKPSFDQIKVNFTGANTLIEIKVKYM